MESNYDPELLLADGEMGEALPENNEVMNEEIPIESTEEVVEEGVGGPVEEALTEQELSAALKDLLLMAREEDRPVRDAYLNVLIRLEYYWNNVLDIFRDELTGQYRVPNWSELEDEIPPRLINIYRPNGEAIVAALSVAVPGIYFAPDDPDNPDDVQAAKAYRSISELIQVHNSASLQIIKVITTIFNQGTVFGYCYPQSNPKFGTIQTPIVGMVDVTEYQVHCPQCGEPLDAGPEVQEAYQCPQCGYQGPIEGTPVISQIPQIVGYDETPKSRINQEIFSSKHVKIPAYTTKQQDNGYLLLEFLQSVSMLRSVFQDKANQINSGSTSDWEGFAKIPIIYLDQQPDNAANVSALWLRPWQFWHLSDSVIVQKLLKKFPSGCYAIFINDEFMTAYDEDMDDMWTISANPMGDNLLMRPLGENLATIQDIRAQLVEIELQTAEYGIPEVFADPRVLDFTKYGASRSKPGMVTKAKAISGKTLAEGFHMNKPAVLSPEIDPLRRQIDQDAQFVSGAFPSVYGGTNSGGSKTAAEYQQSRSAALQRLGTIWKIASDFLAQFQSRSATLYANILRELNQDERFAKREGASYVNVWIRSTMLKGKVGRVEPESSEQLPITWAQKKDAIEKLLATNNEMITGILSHPRNSLLVKEALGLNDIYVPGEDARMRQLAEFNLLMQGIPVPINVEIDNHQVHIETLISVLEGPVAEQLSEEGFQATMEHLMQHKQVMAERAMAEQEQMMAQQQAAQQGSAPGGSQNGEDNG